MKTSSAIPASVEEARKEWAREVMSSQKLVSHGKVRPERIDSPRDPNAIHVAASFIEGLVGELDDWFKNKGEHNRWVQRIDMRFVIDQEFLDKSSRCCGFYHYTGRLVRHG